MKAFLLAAGLGTRLRPLTDTVPKCLVPIAGTPLLDIWLDRLASAGVDEVLVNLHHLPFLIEEHLRSRRTPPVVTTTFEPELLGSAGTLRANSSFVAGQRCFLVCNADGLLDFDLRALVSFHLGHGALATLGLFHSPTPEACGIVELDGAGRIVDFVEKPSHPRTDLANAGVYVFDPDVIGEIQGPPPTDIGYDLLPRLLGRAWGMPIPGYFRDIGTVDAYRLAQAEWPTRTAI